MGTYNHDNDIDLQLFDAVKTDDKDDVLDLLSSGASVNWPNPSYGNQTPLHVSCAAGFRDIANLLLASGSEFDKTNDFAETPLMEACGAGHTDIAADLIRAGAELELQDLRGTSALMMAAAEGHVDVVRLLLQRGASACKLNNNRDSALHLTASGEVGCPEVAEILIQHGADPFALNDEGHLPVEYAEEKGHEELKEFLRSVHGKPMAPRARSLGRILLNQEARV